MMIQPSKAKKTQDNVVEKRASPSKWSKWVSVSLALAGALVGSAGCSSSSGSNGCSMQDEGNGWQACICQGDGGTSKGTITETGQCVPGNSSVTDAGSCAVSQSKCSDTTGSAMLNAESATDSTMVVGSYIIRLDLTGDTNGTLYATVDLLDNCSNQLANATVPSQGSQTFSDGSTQITMSIGTVSENNPKSAQVTASIQCLMDGGKSDAFVPVDSGKNPDASTD